ncbi:MAG: hypothetical protein MAGBODY4_01007 [Candidatus Marinimicrobia bacterium]|nr:hypothetical protein [Candidatus Neomarinimicrobiota bacterium]
MKTTQLLLYLLILPGMIFAQDPFETMDDAFTEMESDQLTLRFFNALNGEPIPAADVTIESIGTYQTDGEGKILFPIPAENDTYKVTFSKQGYVKAEFPLAIEAGTIFFNRFSVSPALPLGNMRIVLDWDSRPEDLDAHFIKESEYHISYQDMRVSGDGVDRLDRDDRNGYGPETITAKKIDKNAHYDFLVHDYSNRSRQGVVYLSRSKATVKIYQGSELLHMLTIPRNQIGTIWHVFSIRNGEIELVNELFEHHSGI